MTVVRMDVCAELWVLLGEKDEVILPEKSRPILEKMRAKVTYGTHAHRTPTEVFSKYMNSIMPELMG